MRAGLWLPCATPAKAPMPSFVNSSGPSASAVRCSWRAASSLACSARRSGVSSFAPVFARSRARLAASAIVAARAVCSTRSSSPPDEHESLERRLVLRLALPAPRVVGAEQDAVHDRARLLRVRERVVEDPGKRSADALCRVCDRGRRGADRVRVELVCGSQADEDDPAGRPVGIEDGCLRGPLGEALLLGDACHSVE